MDLSILEQPMRLTVQEKEIEVFLSSPLPSAGAGGLTLGVTDTLYARLGTSYSKAEADARFVSLGVSYTKNEADARFAATASLSNSYTKLESDARYSLLGTSYTKAEADSRFALSGSSVDAYTKTQSDGRYMPLAGPAGAFTITGKYTDFTSDTLTGALRFNQTDTATTDLIGYHRNGVLTWKWQVKNNNSLIYSHDGTNQTIAFNSDGTISFDYAGVSMGVAADPAYRLRVKGHSFYAPNPFLVEGYNSIAVPVAVVRRGASASAAIMEWQAEDFTPLVKVSNEGNVEITSSSCGLILKSPNGTRFRVTINDSGVVTSTAL